MKKTIFILIFLMLLGLVSAVPPQSSSATVGLEIKYPPFDQLILNGDVEFPFHVYSLESGLVQNTNVNCSFHLYNDHGVHLLTLSDTTPSHLYDYEFVVGSGNFSVGGHYAFTTYCECTGCAVNAAYSNLGGFVTEAFTVYSKDFGDSKDNLPTIIALIGLIGLLFYFAYGLDKEHFLLKLLTLFFAVFNLVLIPSVLIKGAFAFQDNLLRSTLWFARLFVLYIFLYFNYTIWIKQKLIDFKLIKEKGKNI